MSELGISLENAFAANGGTRELVGLAAHMRSHSVVYPSTLTFQGSVQDPSYLPIDVQATVYLRQGANAGAVRAAIQKALADFFAVSLPDGTPNPSVDFGFNLKDAEGNPAGEIAARTFSTSSATSRVSSPRRSKPPFTICDGLHRWR